MTFGLDWSKDNNCSQGGGTDGNTHQAACQVVPIEVMLQEAGQAEEGQAELLEAELDGLWGPNAGAQLENNSDMGSTGSPQPLHRALTYVCPGDIRRLQTLRLRGRLILSQVDSETHRCHFLGVHLVQSLVLGELGDDVAEQGVERLVRIRSVLGGKKKKKN